MEINIKGKQSRNAKKMQQRGEKIPRKKTVVVVVVEEKKQNERGGGGGGKTKIGRRER